MSSSWSNALGRLGFALTASAALHLAVGVAIEALPWQAPRGDGARPAPARIDVRIVQQAPAAARAPARSSKGEAPRAAGERYYLASELDARPAPREPVEPVYPNDAFLRDIAGRVIVRLFITESGEVEKALVVHAEPAGYFEQAVEQAFRAARFTPAMKHGRAVKAQMVVEVRYDSPLGAGTR